MRTKAPDVSLMVGRGAISLCILGDGRLEGRKGRTSRMLGSTLLGLARPRRETAR